jgi:ribonuclease HI
VNSGRFSWPKDPEPIVGGRVLGLRIQKSQNGELMWSRDNLLREFHNSLTKREVFSLCGQLTGHFPVARWLRPACSYIKRCVNDIKWNEKVDKKTVSMIKEVMVQVQESDPVKGRWNVSKTKKGKIWCDASCLATSACIEIDGIIVEDAAWLRPQKDSSHINVAELEAVIKGITLALKWNLSDIEILTDSGTVHGWMKSLLEGDRRIRVHGLSEALVHRRLSLIKDVIDECKLKVSISYVRSNFNKADELTRVPKRWLVSQEFIAGVAVSNVSPREIKEIHNQLHAGVDKTEFLVQCRYPNSTVDRKTVEEVVKACNRCNSIDPHPVHWKRGVLEVQDPWSRLACDVTHFKGRKYLTIIDCGPSRFSIWKLIKSESDDILAQKLENVFQERGPPKELLVDNGKSFRSKCFLDMCDKWGVHVHFRAAYRPQGNGIIERHHRTIKSMAARSNADVRDIVFWINFCPRNSSDHSSQPCNGIFKYKWRYPKHQVSLVDNSHNRSDYQVGEVVFVKPSISKCTSKWKRGVITKVGGMGAVTVEVNGMPRHVADLRRVWSTSRSKQPEMKPPDLWVKKDQSAVTEAGYHPIEIEPPCIDHREEVFQEESVFSDSVEETVQENTAMDEEEYVLEDSTLANEDDVINQQDLIEEYTPEALADEIADKDEMETNSADRNLRPRKAPKWLDDYVLE